MKRVQTTPRPDWTRTVESQGLLFHSLDGAPYWDEGAYYLFEAREVDLIEKATYALNEMCLKAVEHVIANDLFPPFRIAEPFVSLVKKSWEIDEQTVYGRFDLAYDGSRPPKLLEYNADTPTALLEAAVIQWHWFQDVVGPLNPQDRAQFDQFNSIHERLIEAWRAVKAALGDKVAFAALRDPLEDFMTVGYLRDTAIQAGLQTEFLEMGQIGWHAGRHAFTDLRERPIPVIFKLYPWEWLINEPFGRNIPRSPTRWLEAPWKMLLSNKAILPVLSALFPDSPYLLRTEFEPFGDTYVIKPTQAREGANITIVQGGRTTHQTDGPYAEGPSVYQEFSPLPDHGGRYPVVGSWLVNGNACGVGIREADGLITQNTSRFVPHLFRRSIYAAPPGVLRG